MQGCTDLLGKEGAPTTHGRSRGQDDLHTVHQKTPLHLQVQPWLLQSPGISSDPAVCINLHLFEEGYFQVFEKEYLATYLKSHEWSHLGF